MNTFLTVISTRDKAKALFSQCIHKQFCSLKDINKYSTFSMLPRDITQQIFDDLVCSQCLTDTLLEAFRECALQVSLKRFI